MPPDLGYLDAPADRWPPTADRNGWSGDPDVSTPERAALARVAAAAAGATAIDEIVELVAEEARRALHAASLSISRWERDRDRLRELVSVGEPGAGDGRFPADGLEEASRFPQIQRLLRQGEPYHNAVGEPGADPRAVELLSSVGKASDLAVPIVVDGGSWGEVWAATAPGQPRFTGAHVRFLEAVAGQLAVAIERAELFARVSRLAYEDPLTRLPNRRALEDRLQGAAARARGRRTPLTLLLCDLDGLKVVNDEHGHAAGDLALRRVAEALVAAAADCPGGLVARLGGDEFCVLLEGSDLGTARELAAAAQRTLREGDGSRLSLSCGAAESAPGIRTPRELLAAADAAQYAAKRHGGGQFCTVAGVPARAVEGLDRRDGRRPPAARMRAATRQAVERLEGPLRGASALDRLEAVAVLVAEAVNAAGWAVSFAAAGGRTVATVSSADARDARLRGLRVRRDEEVYRLEDYPATARLLTAGCGTFLARLSDGAGEPAERALLEEMGHESVLAAAAGDRAGAWLVEVYGDTTTPALEVARHELALLTRAAIPPAGTAARAAERSSAVAAALATSVAGATREDVVLSAAAEELRRSLGFRICTIVRLRGDRMLELAADASRVDLTPDWTQPAGGGLIGRALRERRTVVTGEAASEPDRLVTPADADCRSEAVVPIRVGMRRWGALKAEELAPDAFGEEEIEVLEGAAAVLGAALGAVELYQRLERAYLGTAEALAAALEAKDAYTAEHSRSLGRHSVPVARLLDMPEDELRDLRYAAALHDIGKIAVPESTLNKPGPLTREEWAAVRQHPLVGARILSPIDFLAGALPMVRHAHERWDGRGYPDGLAGEAVPLGARILLACDAYDAMTSDRPYRAALGEPDARAELRRGSGSQFDPRVVDALLTVLETPAGA